MVDWPRRFREYGKTEGIQDGVTLRIAMMEDWLVRLANANVGSEMVYGIAHRASTLIQELWRRLNHVKAELASFQQAAVEAAEPVTEDPAPTDLRIGVDWAKMARQVRLAFGPDAETIAARLERFAKEDINVESKDRTLLLAAEWIRDHHFDVPGPERPEDEEDSPRDPDISEGIVGNDFEGRKEEAPFDSELAQELFRVKTEGYRLVLAAVRVAKEGDGVHRLLKASARFLEACADEFGRGEKGDPRRD